MRKTTRCCVCRKRIVITDTEEDICNRCDKELMEELRAHNEELEPPCCNMDDNIPDFY